MLACLCVGPTACGGSPSREVNDTITGPVLDDGPATTGPDASSSESSDGADDGDDGDEKLDMSAPPPMQMENCYAADLLFVIDNSGSMCPAQEGLADALPGLVDAMFDALPVGTDLHVGIVTTSFSEDGPYQEIDCAPNAGPLTIENAYNTETVVPYNGYQGRLFSYDDRRYFSANTEIAEDRPALTQWFTETVLDVGCGGGAFEFPAAAAAYALGPSNAENNAGFLRDEGAALAIFVLTNGIDLSLEPIETYRDMILDAKAECGGAECIVTAGLLSSECVPDTNPVIWQFLNAFGTEPSWGPIDDFAIYDDIVTAALAEALVQACEQIDPVG
jgi:hypothetical protein